MGNVHESRRMPKRALLSVVVGILGLLGLGCGLVAVRGAWSVVMGTQFLPRHLEVQVDGTLTPENGWRSGKSPLSKPPAPEEWIEVTQARVQDDQLRILIKRCRPPNWFDTEISLSVGSDGIPSVRVRGGAHQSNGRAEWPDRNIGGLVRISSANFSPEHSFDEADFVIEYRLESDCSGSPVKREGKVVLTRDDLR